ncbi:hypothetical protein K458DRAFT_169350 [Lentithecium fluviatile CBS 122367]|uniref:Uncharacterized protein n=1 Tax=Lentithecium fluviatile CBS 122367 TaxID=1168545 RepID=A0A6G1JB15_9PLEO|nr:hypothetical protein K458DRAFT_169350 [Lentithecium fluviatile CBS 122367]
MCLLTTKPTPTYRGSIVDPPPHRSRFSAHPPPGVVRLPRGSTHSYRRSSTEYRRSEPRVIEYVEEPRRRSRSVVRNVEYVEEPRRRSKSVVRDVEVRGSRGSFVEGRRSVSRVRY